MFVKLVKRKRYILYNMIAEINQNNKVNNKVID